MLDKKTYLYFLLESQTAPDFYFPHRREKYRLLITEEHLKTENFLPRILTLCLYSGSQPFKTIDYANPELNTLFNSPVNSPGFYLINLHQQQDAFLAESGIFQVLLKIGSQYKKEVLGWMKAHLDYVVEVLESPYKCTGLSYLLELEKRNNPFVVLENITKLIPKHTHEIMNYVQKQVLAA